MKMNEVMAGIPAQRTDRFQHPLTLMLDHQQADHFRRLARDRDDLRVLGVRDMGEEKAEVIVGCVSAEVRDLIQQAW